MYVFQLLQCSKHLCLWCGLSSQLLQQSPASVVEYITPAPAAIAALLPVVEYFPPVIIVFVVPALAVCAAPAVRVQWKAKDVAASHLSTAVPSRRDVQRVFFVEHFRLVR